MTDNSYWQSRLRAQIPRCQLPADTQLVFEGDDREVTITILAAGADANMQSDSAAVEGWSLALMSLCDVQRVRVRIPASTAKARHYERLLYRLARFGELFPDRVTLDGPGADASLRVTSSSRVLNQPLGRECAAVDEQDARLASVNTDLQLARSETALEKALEVCQAMKTHFELEKLMRQWPVGLFDGRVSKHQHIFTGGKSAIDLLGIRGETLFVFELKTFHNRKVGALTELLFYACVMRDALGPTAEFQFERPEAAKHCAVAPADIVNCRQIEAVLLAPRTHPVIADRRPFALLNAAAAQRWRDRPVHFLRAVLKGFDGRDFSIESVAD